MFAMITQILISIVVMAVSGGSRIADEFMFRFYDDAQKRFGDKLSIEASAIREDGKVRIIVKNTSTDFIAIAKSPQRSSIRYYSDGKWRNGAAGVTLLDTELLDHVILRPPKDREHRRTGNMVFEMPSSHEGDSMAEIMLNLGAYFPSIHDYINFWIVAKVTLEIATGEKEGADQPAIKTADKVPAKAHP